MTERQHRFCVAPMMEWTDRHDRYFLRLLSRHTRLYSEMRSADAVIHGDKERILGFSPCERPLALQLGGSEPAKLAQAAQLGEAYGYDEINLNIGCPSPRVQKGAFGACLMREPALVAECVSAMRQGVEIPVSVKCRLGVDEQDEAEALWHLVEASREAGCKVFIVHARKAWLEGLSPKQNRDVPPLNYPLVYRLKRHFPDLTIVLNGGIESLAQAEEHLAHVDGVMLGRAAYQNPYILAEVDKLFFDDDTPPRTRLETLEALIPYGQSLTDIQALTRHLMGLYKGQKGGKQWRRFLSENARQGDDVLTQASQMMRAYL